MQSDEGVFSLGLLQAVNDWQRGYDPRAKLRRAERLKAATSSLPECFRSASLVSFRQISLVPGNLWRFGRDLKLEESVSSWTFDLATVKSFKGGVPPGPFQGVIFELVPRPAQVVVNVAALYSDNTFRSAVDAMRSHIVAFDDGIGRYGGSQSEIVLDVELLPLAAVYAVGGFSSERLDLARMYHGKEPSEAELMEFSALLEQAKRTLGGNWLTGAGKDRVLDTLTSFVADWSDRPKTT